VGEEDEVAGHKRYANPTRSLKKPYRPRNIELDRKNLTELVMALFNKVTKSGALRSNISSKGGLLFLNGPKGGLQVGIVSRGWLRGKARLA